MLSLTKKTLETKHHNKQIYTYNLNCLLQLGQLDGVHYKVNTFINSIQLGNLFAKSTPLFKNDPDQIVDKL